MIEFIVTAMTFAMLRRKGFQPLLLLNGLAREYKRTLIFAPVGVWVYYWVLQHTNFGVDTTFRLRWITEPDSQWQCGLNWSSA